MKQFSGGFIKFVCDKAVRGGNRVPGTQDNSFISIYTKPGGISIPIQYGKRLDDSIDIVGF